MSAGHTTSARYTTCSECDAPAEIRRRFVLESTNGHRARATLGWRGMAHYLNATGRRHAGDTAEFDGPNYDQNVEDATGVPEAAARLRQLPESSDSFIIVSPEYNTSMPGGLKNLIDWMSRYRPQPFHQRHGLMMSASPSMVGGNRGLWALRVPLKHLGARIYPDMFSLCSRARTVR